MSDDPRLTVFGKFTPEGVLQPGYGDHYLFFVGRDDVHSVLLWIIQNERLAFRLNMFGYDDEELNQAIIDLIGRPSVVEDDRSLRLARGLAEPQVDAEPSEAHAGTCLGL